MINNPSPRKRSGSSSSSSSQDQATLSKKVNPNSKLDGEEIEVIPLEIERAPFRISTSKTKDPKFSKNLRWVRNIKKNREILFDYIINKVLIRKIIIGANWSYLPCCNTFCRQKPTGVGHHGVKWNPLLFLLNEEERSKVLTFKKKLRLKNSSLSPKDFHILAKPELLNYIKAELELKKLREIITALPQKDDCFHLPLITERFTDDCPGPCPLAHPDQQLDFKVDLYTIGPVDIAQDQVKSPKPSKSQKRTKVTTSGENHLKKLKIKNEPNPTRNQEENTQGASIIPPMSQDSIQNYTFSQSNRGNQVATHLDGGQPIDTFGPSPGTAANFEAWSKQTSSHQGSLFVESRSSSPFSPNRSNSPNQQMGELQGQFKNLVLGGRQPSFGEVPKLSQRNNFSGHGFPSFSGHQGAPLRGEGAYQMTEVEKCERLHQLALLHQQKQRELQEVTRQVSQKEQEVHEEENKLVMIEEQIEQLVKIAHQRRKEDFESGSGKDPQ